MREAIAKIEAEDAATAERARKRAAAEMAERVRLREQSPDTGSTPAPSTPATPKVPAGWYPHPSMAETRRYWDGQGWTDHISPMDSPTTSSPNPSRQPPLVSAAILAGAVIGLIMSLQSASLMTGSGAIWTGFAIAAGASVAANWVLKKGLPTWVRVIAALCAVIALLNAIYVESQLEDMRQDIRRDINQIGR